MLRKESQSKKHTSNFRLAGYQLQILGSWYHKCWLNKQAQSDPWNFVTLDCLSANHSRCALFDCAGIFGSNYSNANDNGVFSSNWRFLHERLYMTVHLIQHWPVYDYVQANFFSFFKVNLLWWDFELLTE